MVMEAINSDKSWEEIKDLLWLKLCHTNIHTSTTCFMDIQQWEKKFLAAYIFMFKTKARGSSFTNDAPLSGLSLKRLKNAHFFAMHIYIKRLPTLIDAIS